MQRECGSFFTPPAEQTLVSLNFTPPFLVPKALKQAPASQYLKMQQEVSDSDEVFEDDLGDYVAIYALPLSKTLPLRTTLQNPKFHHTYPLLYLIWHRARRNAPTSCCSISAAIGWVLF